MANDQYQIDNTEDNNEYLSGSYVKGTTLIFVDGAYVSGKTLVIKEENK